MSSKYSYPIQKREAIINIVNAVIRDKVTTNSLPCHIKLGSTIVVYYSPWQLYILPVTLAEFAK
jgi:hypothetical protein